MTGDFNCGAGTPAMQILRNVLPKIIDGGIDHILTDQGKKEWGGKREGSPSDHPLIKGSFTISGSGGSGSDRRRRTGGQGSGNCQDANNQCSYWASAGECARNPQYMKTNCKKSCNACSGSGSPRRRRRAATGGQGSGNCQDANNQCSYWATAGECARNPQYMRVNCKRSCNACSGSGGTCNDGNNQCRYWASSGECTRNPQYMRANCKKSCNIC